MSGIDTQRFLDIPPPRSEGPAPRPADGPARRVDFFGQRIDAALVPLAIAIRSTAIDEGRAGDLRRANAFRETEGRAEWQVRAYEAGFQAAVMGMVGAADDARLAELERLYPDPDAVVLARAAGEAIPGAAALPPGEDTREEATGGAVPAPAAARAEGQGRATLDARELAAADALHAAASVALGALRARARAARVRTAALAALRPLVAAAMAEGATAAEVLDAMAAAGFPASAHDLAGDAGDPVT